MVTGNSGFLGSAVGRVLRAAGAVVHGTGFSRIATSCSVFHRMSLPEDAQDLIETVQPSVVFHLAAPVNPDMERDEAACKDAIVSGSEAIADACAHVGSRLVHTGTCAEYGSIPTPYREDQGCQPSGAYGVLKYAATQRIVGSSTLEWSVVRPFRALGPGDNNSVVALAARAALRGEPFGMTDGKQVREWNHVDAVAQGIVAAGAHPGAVREVINIGGGPLLSVREMVQRVFQCAGADTDLIRVGERPRRSHEVDTLFGDHSKAVGLWGTIAGPPLEGIIQAVIDDQRSSLGVVA